MSVLAVFLALLIGVTLGLLGGGGSTLTVPVFVYALGYDPKLAIAMSLPVVGGASLVGAIRHWRLGNIDLRTAVPFGLAAMVGAFGGAQLARFLSGRTQLMIFAVVLAAAAITMFRNARRQEPAVRAEATGERATAAGERAEAAGERAKRMPWLLVAGVATGTLTGIVGVGGGFMMVPALVILGGVPMKKAVGTSLLVIATNTATAYAGYHDVVDVPWNVVISFGLVTVVGIFVGAAFIRRVPQQVLKRAFAMLLIAIALLIFWQNRSLF